MEIHILKKPWFDICKLTRLSLLEPKLHKPPTFSTILFLFFWERIFLNFINTTNWIFDSMQRILRPQMTSFSYFAHLISLDFIMTFNDYWYLILWDCPFWEVLIDGFFRGIKGHMLGNVRKHIHFYDYFIS